MPVEPAVGVAAFDFDGTLIRGQSMWPFLVKVAGSTRVAATMPAMVAAYGRSDRDGAKVVVVERLLGGYPAAALEELGRTYGIHLARRVRRSMAERVGWHRREGHRLLIVSASLEVYLAATTEALDFDGLLATRLEVGTDDRMTGKLQGANCRGPEKEARLRQWLSDHLGDRPYRLWAYGDSRGDDQLLAMADTATRV